MQISRCSDILVIHCMVSTIVVVFTREKWSAFCSITALLECMMLIGIEYRRILEIDRQIDLPFLSLKNDIYFALNKKIYFRGNSHRSF